MFRKTVVFAAFGIIAAGCSSAPTGPAGTNGRADSVVTRLALEIDDKCNDEVSDAYGGEATLARGEDGGTVLTLRVPACAQEAAGA